MITGFADQPSPVGESAPYLQALNITDPTLITALQEFQQRLQNFAQSSTVDEILGTSFGVNYNPESADSLINNLAQGNFNDTPEIKIIDSDILENANGAYAAQLNTIFLSDDFVNNNSSQEIAGVILEEYGHFIDDKINIKDSAGDEGDIFSRLVQGKGLYSAELALLKEENDSNFITYNGQSILIEQALPYQTVKIINQAGEVWAHNISGNTIGSAYRMTGALVAYGGTPAKAVLSQDDSNRILVVNTKGEVWAHNISGNTVGSAYRMTGALVAYRGTPARSIVADNNKIFVINTQGEVWAHNISGNTVGSAYKMSGALVAAPGGIPAQAVVAENNKLLVINTQGKVWAHNLSGNTVGNAYKMTGSLVASPSGLPAKSISAEDNRIVVINSQGEVWAHNISANTIGSAYRISGSAVATGGTPVNYFVSDSSYCVNTPRLVRYGDLIGDARKLPGSDYAYDKGFETVALKSV